MPVYQKDKNCLQDAITVALNHEETGKHSEGINFPSEKNDSKKFQKNNLTITLNVFYAKKEKKHILRMFQDITQIVKNGLLY